MSLVLSRVLTYATAIMYLAVGTVAYRLYVPEVSTVTISSNYLNVFSKTQIADAEIPQIEAPVLVFEEIKFPNERASSGIIKKISLKKIKPVVPQKVFSVFELPFYEPVVLGPVHFDGHLLTNLIALYKDLDVETQKFIAELKKTEPVVPDVKDEVSTIASASVDEEVTAEPEFFEYPIEDSSPVPSDNKVAPIVAASVQISNPVQTKEVSQEAPSVISADKPEEVEVNDLLVFDYSAAKKDIEINKVTTTTVPTRAPAPIVKVPVVAKASQATADTSSLTAPQQNEEAEDNQQGFVDNSASFVDENTKPKKSSTFSTQMTIQAVSTDMKISRAVNGFEVRFQDNDSDIVEDFGSGEVVLKEDLAQPKMTRSAVVLKRGFIPTNTDLILEEGVVSVSVPLIEEEAFNESISNDEARGPVGAILVELDDETDAAQIDVPFGKIIFLDGDLKKTTGADFRYQLFMGVRAGNALLSYKGFDRGSVTKVVHIHEREVTFEANYFEKVKNEKVKLFEEDLLAKDKAPLIISSEQVKQFASTNKTKKINDHTYKMNFGKTLLGARSYLELNHLSEPTFIGFREKTSIDVPSENFMRFILSRFDDSKLGNRCLVQINLSKKADRMEVAAESVGASLVTYTQVLDADGKFYDSIGEKSRKIIVVGENHSNSEIDQNGKINVKIIFQDGTTQFLNTYCSPNTYLVEQL